MANSFLEAFKQQILTGVKQEAGRQAQDGSVSPFAPANTRLLGGGKVAKGANLRAGPGQDNAKVGYLPAGTRVGIAERSGNWYRIEANVNGEALRGWVYSPLIEVGGPAPAVAAAAPGVSGGSAAGTGAKPRKEISYTGYSEQFQPIKKMLETGDLKGVDVHYEGQNQAIKEKARNEKQFLEQVGLVSWLEQGTLALDRGEFDTSVESFTFAERLIDLDDQQSWLRLGFDRVMGEGTGLITGDGEMQDYLAVGYERVLMLNYKSIAYMLEGQRNAYNVTRRAIDWQKLEQKAFDEKRREVEKQLAEKKAGTSDAGNATADDLDSQISADYAKFDKKALSVPSAYVNPFGYYVQGMVQEYESYDDWSLRDNARISYEKALELNPGSKVLKRAVSDMKKPKGSQGSRLVHVVVADGFVPEKKMLTYRIQSHDGDIPIKLTMYEPDPSPVHRIEVQTTGGKRLARLSPVADVEALCLRYQKDLEALRSLRVVSATVAGQLTKGVIAKIPLFGKDLSEARLEAAKPDMRSWMSLPSTIQAARLRLRKGVSRFKIVSYDKKGRRLASKVVNINSGSHDFVYARSIGSNIQAYAANGLWMLAGR
jgi:hypothetical protein